MHKNFYTKPHIFTVHTCTDVGSRKLKLPKDIIPIKYSHYPLSPLMEMQLYRVVKT